jgi:hypothetical protein
MFVILVHILNITDIITPYLLTYLLTPRSRVLEKLTGSQLVKKSLAFYGNRRFITTFTTTRHLSLSWARSIKSMTPYPTSWRSILILPSHLRPALPSGSFPQVSPPKPVYTSLVSNTCHMPHPSHSSRFYHPNNIWWAVQIIKAPHYVVSSTPMLTPPS